MTAFTSMQPQTSSRVSQLAGSPLRQQHKACFSASRRSLAVRASGDGSRVDKFDKHSIIVSPSILSADFAKLGEQIKAVEAAGADWIHVDVMDGRFVPNITIGPLIVAAIRPLTDLPLDTHLVSSFAISYHLLPHLLQASPCAKLSSGNITAELQMIVHPEERVADFAKAGSDIISVHAEPAATVHLDRTINQIKDLGVKAGVVLNPATPIETIQHVITQVDLILLMSVNPGFGGQKFIEYQVEKVRKLRQMCNDAGVSPWIEVDGGISGKNAYKVIEAGANALVAGSAVFGAPDYSEAIKSIKTSKNPAHERQPVHA
ncbi:TPA: hypothetical protein ACH3X1_006745 [Trebouxia sp. C0004]